MFSSNKYAHTIKRTNTHTNTIVEKYTWFYNPNTIDRTSASRHGKSLASAVLFTVSVLCWLPSAQSPLSRHTILTSMRTDHHEPIALRFRTVIDISDAARKNSAKTNSGQKELYVEHLNGVRSQRTRV